MMGCPLCGKLTHNASTRLIRDTCGHLKCRLCLLKEETGCRVCEAQLRIDSIGRFDYPLPASKTPNYEFPDCKPHELSINRIPVNVEINDLSQSTEEETIIDENNLKNQNNEIQTETNANILQSEVNNTTDNQNINEQNASTFQKVILVGNTNSNDSNESQHVNNDRALVTEEREKVTEDAQHKDLDEQTNLQNNTNENQTFYQLTPVSSRLIENSSQAVNSRVESSDSSHCAIPKLQQSIALTRSPSKLKELEKLNSSLPNKTPNHLSYASQESRLLDPVGSPFKSPAFRMSDYLTFNKQHEKSNRTPSSANGKTPDFRLSDYVVFKDRFSPDEVTQSIDNYVNEPGKKSSDYITSDGFLVERISEGDESSMMDIEDEFPHNLFNETDTATDNSSSVPDTFSHPILTKKRTSNSSTINFSSKQSQNTRRNLKGTNSSLKPTKRKNCKEEDDEDKENKKHKKEKVTKRSTKSKSDTRTARTAALKRVNRPSKSKARVVHSLKTKNIKRKKKEESDKLSDEPIATRRGERKRKRKMLLYENEVLEMLTEKRNYRRSSFKWDESPERKAQASPKRRGRKPKTDWSHVVRLPGSPASYRCSVCNANFHHWRGRTAHAGCSLGLPPFHCNTCDRSFYKRTHYEYHERTHTGEKPYSCHLCGKNFVQQNKLNRHLSVHQQQNSIECDICGKKYKTKEYLKNHLITHKENVYKCSQCPKTFTLAANRKRHELSHSTERPFTCDICSKSFKYLFLKTRHRRLHDKSRPYNCDQCKRSFLTKFEVRRHMVSHTDTKPYVCEICKVEFRRQDNLKRHVLHHHTQDAPVDGAITGDSAESEDERLLISGPSTPEISKRRKPRKVKTKKTETEQEASEPDKVKNVKKPKKVSRKNSTASSKTSSKSSKTNISNTAVPISIPASTSNFFFADDMSREEARLLNQQIELKMQSQNSFCHFPGVTRNIDLRARRESLRSNSNSNDATAANQNQETEKIENSGNEEPKQNDKPYVHWRRRTAESLRPSLENKSQKDMQK